MLWLKHPLPLRNFSINTFFSSPRTGCLLEAKNPKAKDIGRKIRNREGKKASSSSTSALSFRFILTPSFPSLPLSLSARNSYQNSSPKLLLIHLTVPLFVDRRTHPHPLMNLPHLLLSAHPPISSSCQGILSHRRRL